MEEQLERKLNEAYSRFYSELTLSEKIHHKKFITPKDLVQVREGLKKDGEANGIENLSKFEKRIYTDVVATIIHRTPDDIDIEKFTYNVESINKLFEHYLSNDYGDNRPVVFQGIKGSGKTTSLNLFTKRCNDDIEKNKLLIVRGNAQEYQKLKVESLILDPKSENIKLSISSYMRLKFAFLLANQNSSPFDYIIKNIFYNKCIVSNRAFKKENKTNLGTVQDLLNYINSQISILLKNSEGLAKGREVYKILRQRLDLIAKNANIVTYNDWFTLVNIAIDFCKKENIKIIYIIDGIDNVYSFSKDTRKAYDSMIDDVSNYFTEVSTEEKYIDYLVACRPETGAVIRKSMYDYYSHCPAVFISHSENEFHEIILKKLTLVKEVLLKLESKLDTSLPLDEFNIIQSFLEIEKYTDLCKRLARESRIDDYMDIFSGNLRSYLFNYITFSITRAAFLKKTKLTINNISINTEYDLFLKNLFSGGRNFIDTTPILHENKSNNSVVFPNPFFYNFPSESLLIDIVDHTLAVFQILKAVDDISIISVPENIIDTAVKESLFNEKIIEDMFEKLVQFRIVEHSGNENSVYNEYVTTKSAQVLLNIIHKHPAILTWLVFDSVMSLDLWNVLAKDMEKYNMHDNYLALSVVVGTRYFAFLNKQSSSQFDVVFHEYKNYSSYLANFMTSAIRNKTLTLNTAENLISTI